MVALIVAIAQAAYAFAPAAFGLLRELAPGASGVSPGARQACLLPRHWCRRLPSAHFWQAGDDDDMSSGSAIASLSLKFEGCSPTPPLSCPANGQAFGRPELGNAVRRR